MISTIDKPIRVTRKTQQQLITFSLIVLLTQSLKSNFKAILKSDIFDHFPICFLVPSSSIQRKNKTSFLCKRIFNTKSIESMKKKLYGTNWQETETSKNLDEAYTTFVQKLIVLYQNFFQK